MSSGQSTGVVDIVQNVTQMSVSEHIVRKTAHVVLYFVLGALICNVVWEYVKRWSVVLLTSVTVACLYAVSDELHQLFVGGRSAQVTDVLLDTVASVVGIVAVLYVYKNTVLQKSQ